MYKLDRNIIYIHYRHLHLHHYWQQCHEVGYGCNNISSVDGVKGGSGCKNKDGYIYNYKFKFSFKKIKFHFKN